MHKITETLRAHYERSFQAHGATAKGVDWGEKLSDLQCRFEKMAAVIPSHQTARPSLLDVGCGYGGLLEHLLARRISVDYTGIDVVPSMISAAQARHSGGRFLLGDILEYPSLERHDYVVCNGILTQKLDAPALEMDEFAGLLIRRMFSLCNRGIAFNVMTTKVNFFSNNLYYRNPAELLSWCMSEITRHVRLDHAYPLYEYTMYLYREPVAPVQA
jgi:SAM-dependent methyltransferase